MAQVEICTDDGKRTTIQTDEPDAYDDLAFTSPNVTAVFITDDK